MRSTSFDGSDRVKVCNFVLIRPLTPWVVYENPDLQEDQRTSTSCRTKWRSGTPERVTTAVVGRGTSFDRVGRGGPIRLDTVVSIHLILVVCGYSVRSISPMSAGNWLVRTKTVPTHRFYSLWPPNVVTQCYQPRRLPNIVIHWSHPVLSLTVAI